MCLDMKALAKANRDKALAKAKENVKINNIVDGKRLNAFATKSIKKSKEESSIEYQKKVKDSEHNYKLCIERPGLIGKLDFVDYSEGLYIMNTVTKEKELIF